MDFQARWYVMEEEDNENAGIKSVGKPVAHQDATVQNMIGKPAVPMLMETLKHLLAFPLDGTAIWLLWVAGRQTGVNTMAVALAGALALALGLWLWRYGGWRRGVALACCLLAATLATWRGLDEADGRSGPLDGGRVAWSEQRLAELRHAGTPVFVDVTADWCITCIANERAVLLTDEMTA